MSNTNGKSIDLSYLAAGSEGLVPMPDGEPIVPVRVNPMQPFIDWVESFFEGAAANVAMRGGTLAVTSEEFVMYVRTLIASRVDFVNGRRAVLSPNELVRVPTFLTVTLSSLGKVHSEKDGVWFMPEHDMDPSLLLSSEEALSVSNRLAPLEYIGYQMAPGYDRDRRGAYDLMAMHFIAERAGVYSHDIKVSAALAPVAYFLGLQQMLVLMGTRIKVAEEVTLRTRLRALSRVDDTKKSA